MNMTIPYPNTNKHNGLKVIPKYPNANVFVNK